MKAIALRSSKALSSPEATTSETITENTEIEKEITKDYVGAKIPFPSRLEEKRKRDNDEFVCFVNLFKALNVNFSLIELIEKVPKYAKFLKEMVAT
ncbi:myb-like protein A [Gossypium australe]|uniref:Myb-like protein A n=1 Tax=Gossypium australe TaxID=47621 RepID=A0A5B6VXJ2_9ROSI|nr:myb-like protein A [Gossypium australe]